MGVQPGVGQLLVARLSRHEVDEVDHDAGNHQHLHVEFVPVCGAVDRYLAARTTGKIQHHEHDESNSVGT